MEKIRQILIIAGTRPEAIKLAPLYLKLQEHREAKVYFCHTGQHRELANEVYDFFDIPLDFTLDALGNSNSLPEMTAYLIKALEKIVIQIRPDLIIVHGDTNSTLSGALVGFHLKVPVAHIESGLRSFDLESPWPEEMNRRTVAILSKYHFAPTQREKNNLLQEGVSGDNVYVVGNTVIDALLSAKRRMNLDCYQRNMESKYPMINFDKSLILFTGHRRENFDGGLKSILNGLQDILAFRTDVEVIFPAHLNPKVHEAINSLLNRDRALHILPHLRYDEFIFFMNAAKLIVTDSGGIQEEAPSLKKPVLVVRQTTERQEMVDAGGLKLIGVDRQKLFNQVNSLLDDQMQYEAMQIESNPYGDGNAASQIADILTVIDFNN